MLQHRWQILLYRTLYRNKFNDPIKRWSIFQATLYSRSIHPNSRPSWSVFADKAPPNGPNRSMNYYRNLRHLTETKKNFYFRSVREQIAFVILQSPNRGVAAFFTFSLRYWTDRRRIVSLSGTGLVRGGVIALLYSFVAISDR